MILQDIGIGGYDQYRLADGMGVVVPKGYAISQVKSLTESVEVAQFGTHVSMDNLNAYFKNEKIPVKAKYISANPYDEYYDENEKYVIYMLSYGHLFHKPELEEVGHAVMKIAFISNRIIRIYDPGPTGSGVKDVDLFDLYSSIYKRSGGVYIFEKVEE